MVTLTLFLFLFIKETLTDENEKTPTCDRAEMNRVIKPKAPLSVNRQYRLDTDDPKLGWDLDGWIQLLATQNGVTFLFEKCHNS